VAWPVRVTSRTPEKPAQWGGQAGPEPPRQGDGSLRRAVGEVNGQSVISSGGRI
jgi:hypothetical protein